MNTNQTEALKHVTDICDACEDIYHRAVTGDPCSESDLLVRMGMIFAWSSMAKKLLTEEHRGGD